MTTSYVPLRRRGLLKDLDCTPSCRRGLLEFERESGMRRHRLADAGKATAIKFVGPERRVADVGTAITAVVGCGRRASRDDLSTGPFGYSIPAD